MVKKSSLNVFTIRQKPINPASTNIADAIPNPVPQTQRAKPNQIRNAAGGFVYKVEDWTMLRRFLVLGVTKSIYESASAQLDKNVEALIGKWKSDIGNTASGLIFTDPVSVWELLMDIHTNGRALRYQPSLFVAALLVSVTVPQVFDPTIVVGDVEGRDKANKELNASFRQVRAAILRDMPVLCRTFDMLTTFVQYCEQMRGWGPYMRKLIRRWYSVASVSADTQDEEDQTDMAYVNLPLQIAKYPERNGRSHRDLIRESHAWPTDAQKPLFYYALGFYGNDKPMKKPSRISTWEFDSFPRIIQGKINALALDATTDIKDDIKFQNMTDLIRKYFLTWEMIPNSYFENTSIWEALLMAGKGMPMTGLIRNISKMSSVGLTGFRSAGQKEIVRRLLDKSTWGWRPIHPFRFLLAAHSYENGENRNFKWTVDPLILEALNKAFYLAFSDLKPTGKNVMYAIDSSQSMSAPAMEYSTLTMREASVAMAMVGLVQEQGQAQIIGFTNNQHMFELPFTPSTSINDAMRILTQKLQGNGTDLSLPWQYAWVKRTQYKLDGIVTLTDSNTWSGGFQVDQAMEAYRKNVNKDCLGINAAMEANAHSVQPKDRRNFEIVGMDSSMPDLIFGFLNNQF